MIRLVNEFKEILLNQFLFVPNLPLFWMSDAQRLTMPSFFIILFVILASKTFDKVNLYLMGLLAIFSRRSEIYSHFCGHKIFKQLTYMINIDAKQIGYNPSVIYSNGGFKFVNSRIQSYSKKHRIGKRTSDSYTPQQNGLAKKFNRTIIESLRSILHNSGMNNRLWNELAFVSYVTINQIPIHKRKKRLSL
ncbi:hypothetical protein VP01_1004g7 [Puccinia sorghi]|uniref:Integrase catalytic domain-containing protein n=1 Tax=Puccinia sorghi TaxID=27349 RepID=A0A0L6VVL1_9BASI|nr:hypothetical protein VP01_1004g7 [Puccinia sorghi]